MEIQEKIQSVYISQVVREGKRPPSLEVFAQNGELAEIVLSEHYLSLNKLEQDILLGSFVRTIERLEAAKEYPSYSGREKLLAFFYTWIEELAPLREFLLALEQYSLPGIGGLSYLESVEKSFKTHLNLLLASAAETGEIAARSLISGQYTNGLWIETRLILHYWLNDASENGERSDAFIEKTINFAFDFMEPNLLDSGLDLVKFLIK